MKTSLRALRDLVRECLLLETGWIVRYKEKNGAPGKPRVFGGPQAERLAQAYAATVRGVAEPIEGIEAPDVSVTDVNASGFGERPATARAPAGTPVPRNWKPKGTYKVYGGSKKHHPGRAVVTRLKGQVYGPAVGAQSAFAPGELGDVSFDNDKLLIKKQDADHVQTWEPFEES